MNKLATISQIKIGEQTYDICDANNRQTTETINNTLATINQDLTAIQNRFDNNGVLKIANGGTAQGEPQEVTNGNALLHALGVAKTAGDEIDITYMNACGFVTEARTKFAFSLSTCFIFYGYSSASFKSGFYTVRQNNDYHFGSTANNLAKVTDHPSWFSMSPHSAGYINISIDTGAEQTRALNNSPCAITFPRPKDSNGNYLETTVIKLN